MGDGDKWSLMVVCIYRWEGRVFRTWKMGEVRRPPRNVLKHQKT